MKFIKRKQVDNLTPLIHAPTTTLLVDRDNEGNFLPRKTMYNLEIPVVVDETLVQGDLNNHGHVSEVIHDVDISVIMNTCPCNEHPLTPHFYIGKLGFKGVYIFSNFALKHRLWVLVRTASQRRF